MKQATISLSKRLEAVAFFVTPGSYLADVGSDHAYLPIYLLKHERIIGAQAIDNKKGPYEGMLSNVREAGLEGKIECTLGDGLLPLLDEVNCLSLCGMGGLLIIDILKKGQGKLDRIKEIVLDAHRDLPKVREEISKMGFLLKEERMIHESGQFYTIMKWGRGTLSAPYSEKEMLLGPCLLGSSDPTYQAYLRERVTVLESLLSSSIPTQKREEYLHQISILKSEIKCD